MSPIVPKVGFNGRFVCDCTLTVISYYADADLQNSHYRMAREVDSSPIQRIQSQGRHWFSQQTVC